MDKVERLQEKITDLSERLSAVKDHLVETAAQAVNAFKEKGKSGMCKIVQKGISGVKSALEDLHHIKTVRQPIQLFKCLINGINPIPQIFHRLFHRLRKGEITIWQMQKQKSRK